MITQMTEAVHAFEMLVYFNETTWCYITEGCHLHTHCHENLKFDTDCLSMGEQNLYKTKILSIINKITAHHKLHCCDILTSVSQKALTLAIVSFI
jgi:hypothetical protein